MVEELFTMKGSITGMARTKPGPLTQPTLLGKLQCSETKCSVQRCSSFGGVVETQVFVVHSS